MGLGVQLIHERLQLGFGGHDPDRRDQLGSLAEQPPRRTMPARAAVLRGLTFAPFRAHGVARAARCGAGDPERLTVEGPGAGFQVQGRAVDGRDPEAVLGGFRASGGEGGGDGLAVDRLCYCCVGRWSYLPSL